jgi:two-component system, LytTR family, response regulator
MNRESTRETGNALRALVVDDEPLARRGLKLRLDAIAGVDIVGECSNGREALAAVARLAPDVVFLDIQMPGLDGFEVAALLAQDDDPPAVVLTSTLDTGDVESRLDPAHVRGFLPKDRLSGPALDALLAD